MDATDKHRNSGSINAGDAESWPGIDSRFRLIVVAAQRNKQLVRGAHPRIEADPRRRRNTSIALEEARRGLVAFTDTHEGPKNGDGAQAESAE
jgi:DNA-directed RNA polymerase omega subunit